MKTSVIFLAFLSLVAANPGGVGVGGGASVTVTIGGGKHHSMSEPMKHSTTMKTTSTMKMSTMTTSTSIMKPSTTSKKPSPTSKGPTKPTGKPPKGPPPCRGGLYAQQACCAVDVVGVASLNCYAPPKYALSAQELTDECKSRGQQAECCSIPLLGQALLCELAPKS